MSDEKKVVKLQRADVLPVLMFVGFDTPGKWPNDRLGPKLASIKDVMPDDGKKPEDEKVAKTLIDVLAGIEEGVTFEVEGGDAPTTGDASTTTVAAVGAPAQTDEEKKKKAEEAEAKKKAKEEKKAASAAKKAAKLKEKEDRKASRMPGVRPSYTDSYMAGLIVKQFGLAAGVTEEMRLAFDKLRGRVNPADAHTSLSWAWHTINAFTGQIPVTPTDRTPKAVPPAVTPPAAQDTPAATQATDSQPAAPATQEATPAPSGNGQTEEAKAPEPVAAAS